MDNSTLFNSLAQWLPWRLKIASSILQIEKMPHKPMTHQLPKNSAKPLGTIFKEKVEKKSHLLLLS